MMVKPLLLVLLLAILVTAGCAHRPEPPPDPFEIRALLLAHDFAALEQLLDTGKPERELEQLYGAFATTDPALVAPLDAWNRAHRESTAAALARAYFAEHRLDLFNASDGGEWAPGARRLDTGLGHEGHDATRALNGNPPQSLAARFILEQPASTAETYGAVMRLVPTTVAGRWARLVTLSPWRYGTMDDIEAYLEGNVRKAPNQEEMQALYGFADYAIAVGYTLKDQDEEALAAIDRALAFGETHQYWDLRAGINSSLGRYQDALADFERALALAPFDASILDRRARTLYWGLKDAEAAYRDWDLALRLDPLNPNLLMYRANAYHNDERYEEALADLETAFAYDFGNPELHYRRARTFIFGQEDYGRGIVEVKQALEAPAEYNPVWAFSWYYYGYALDKLADCAALPAFRTYLAACEAGTECDATALAQATEAIERLHAADCTEE